MDLVLRARAQMADNKVNGPEDSVVSEMIKQLPWENPRDNEVLPGTFHGMRAGSKLLEDRQIGIFEETRRGTEARDQQLQSHCLDVGDVQVVCHLYCHRLCESVAWEVSGRSVWSTHPPTASIQKMKMVATNIRSTHGHNQHIVFAPKERVPRHFSETMLSRATALHLAEPTHKQYTQKPTSVEGVFRGRSWESIQGSSGAISWKTFSMMITSVYIASV